MPSPSRAGRASPPRGAPWTVAVSRSHGDARTESFIDERGGAVRAVLGSAVKFGRVAEGEVDIYPRLSPTSEWDVAAGALLVSEAGGLATDPWGEKLLFNQPDPRTPGMVAAGPHLHPLLIERVRITAHPGAPRRNEA